MRLRSSYGLPSLSRITPLGSFLYPPGSSLISPSSSELVAKVEGELEVRSFDAAEGVPADWNMRSNAPGAINEERKRKRTPG